MKKRPFGAFLFCEAGLEQALKPGLRAYRISPDALARPGGTSRFAPSMLFRDANILKLFRGQLAEVPAAAIGFIPRHHDDRDLDKHARNGRQGRAGREHGKVKRKRLGQK